MLLKPRRFMIVLILGRIRMMARRLVLKDTNASFRMKNSSFVFCLTTGVLELAFAKTSFSPEKLCSLLSDVCLKRPL